MFDVEVKKVDPEFKDRLYFVNNFGNAHGADTRAVWNTLFQVSPNPPP